MPFTVQQMISDVMDYGPDIQPARALKLINRVFRDLCSEFVVAQGSRFVPITASVLEYPLLETEFEVTQCVYFGEGGSGDYLVLDGSDGVEDFNELDPNWRMLPPSRPNKFYTYQGNLGLYPRPFSSTPGQDSSGNSFPVAQIFTVDYPGDLGFNDSLPIVFQTDQAIVEGAAFRYWAAQKDQALMAVHSAAFMAETTRMERFLERRNKRHKTQIVPAQLGQIVV